MINESEEDDAGLVEALRNYLSDMEGACDLDCQMQYNALRRLVRLCVDVDERGKNLGRVSAIRTSTILRVLAAELTGREVTLEMPGAVTFYPEEVDPRG